MTRPRLRFISAVNTMLVVLIHLVPVASQDPAASCVPEIKVRKNTVYTASRQCVLNISCPVTFCQEIPDIKWIKIDNASKFLHISETNQVTITQEQKGLKDFISYLSFRKLSADLSGVYRCISNTSNFTLESHNINVSIIVSISELSGGNVNSTSGSADRGVRWFLHIFIGVGILGLVVSVMLISFLCISRYSRKANSHRHKNAALHLKPLSSSGTSKEIPEEQNNTYDVPTDDLHSDGICLHTANNQECTDMNRSDDGAQIVYAALQHPSPREPSAIRYQSTEQLSEYASIRIG